MTQTIKNPKVGDYVSVWFRPNDQSRYECEVGLAKILKIEGQECVLQLSGQPNRGELGIVSVRTSGLNNWIREFRPPISISPNGVINE